jgi:hypothetical protein
MAWGFFKKIALADNFGAIANAGSMASRPANGPTLALATPATPSRSTATSPATPTSPWLCAAVRHPAHAHSPTRTSREASRSSGAAGTSRCRLVPDYVYVPLGGNRHGRLRQARNVMITFLLSGSGTAVLELRHLGRA